MNVEDIWGLLTANDLEGAAAASREYVAANPSDAAGLRLAAEIEMRKGNWNESEGLLHRAKQIEPHFVVCYGLGLLAHIRGMFQLAAEHYVDALKLGVPNEQESCENVVLALAASGHRESAKSVATQVGAIHPTFAKPLHTLAVSVNGHNPNGNLIERNIVRPVYAGMSEADRQQILAARGFMREYGEDPRKQGLLGGFRRLFGRP